ncbi:putative uncharacterized protein [Rhodococcus sp. AW25M09]|uniref:hypothetical protein n=1 Tax=Rhodococcus sp. AW25M09 TaxID=1268303 RepID=UPI0002AC9CD6|nr:hypothetical protein [Rhodococcus sp. AW25M09]CCQ17526.1 putative uncharacterized protein [Rhodococcus sp. AW25M09]
MTTTAVDHRPADAPETLSRLLVTVRDPNTRQYVPVGFLRHLLDCFEFAYLESALARDDFRPLPGLTHATQAPMRSGQLFPVFAERVVSSRRPDRSASMNALGLPANAAPFEVLARSHGQRVGDTIELLPAPTAGPGELVSFPFLTHGVRHLEPVEQKRIASLSPGDALQLVRDSTNTVNPHAFLVTDDDKIRLGWVPDPLIAVFESLTDRHLTVERANGPEIGFHFRLLVKIAGRTPSDLGLFDGPAWVTRGFADADAPTDLSLSNR